jgi:molecular chaperone GrpE
MEQETKQTEIVETDWKDIYVRLLADFDNHKKRVIKEKDELRRMTKMETLSSVLELDNDLHLATKMIKDDKALSAITIITDKLQKFLKSQGIEEVQTDTYDEDLHEVVSMLQTGETKVVDVVSKGYTMNGTVVKYPKIILSK